MGAHVKMITFDCGAPATLFGWWAERLISGTPEQLFTENLKALSLPEGARTGVQALPDPSPGKNREHLDFSAADVDAAASPPAAAEASEVGRHKFGDTFRWVAPAERQGDVFWVVGRRPPRGPRAAEAQRMRNTVRPSMSRRGSRSVGHADQATISCAGQTVGRPRARGGPPFNGRESRLPAHGYGVDTIETGCKHA